MSRTIRPWAVGAVLAAMASTPGLAATPWSAETHTLVIGDFNADNQDDVLYVAKDINSASGIALSDGFGPNIARQSWPSNYLGIPWYDGLYVPVVADFNGDNHDDILMQSAQPGNSYLILTDSQVWISAISQTIASSHLGQGWSAAEHRLVAGDFNGDARFDLFLQGARKDLSNALYFADGNGQFTSGPVQTWVDSYMSLRWTLTSAIVHAGNFDNSDVAWELFVQAKPDIILIDYEIPFPVPKYRPQSFGIVKVRTPVLCGSDLYVCEPALQRWDRTWQGADWSATTANAIIGDFNGDGRSDIFLQARSSSGQNRLYLANTSGQFTTGDALLDATVRAWTANQYRLFTANVDGTGGAGLYAQAVGASGTNYVAPNITASSAGSTTHTPGQTLAATVAGRTPVTFDVSSTGEGTYSIAIFTPAGAHGMRPQLAISYGHRHGASPVGAGWVIEGLSAITRCPKTWAQDGGSPRDIRLDQYDRFCLDGNQLRLTGGAGYGQAGATYQTELETFARVKSYGAISYPSGGSGPTHFIVEQKDGLIVEYGNTADSRIEAIGTSIPHSWVVSQVRDREGNAINFTWTEDTTNGGYRIANIAYATNPGQGVTTAPYNVVFSYETKPSNEIDSGYLAGSRIKDVTRLRRIELKYNTTTIVRHYELTYEPMLSSASQSRLQSIQECAGTPLECYAPTLFSYQNGTNGFAGETSSGQAIPTIEHALPIDVNGDGRTDLVYSSSTTSGSGTWHVMFANASGGYNAPILTGHTNLNYRQAIPIDYNADGLADVLVPNASSQWAVMLGTTSGLTAPASTAAPVASVEGNAAAIDMNGDGLEDLVWAETTDVYARYRIWGGAFSATATPLANPNLIVTSPVFGQQYRRDPARRLDVNGDGFRDFIVDGWDAASLIAYCDVILGGGQGIRAVSSHCAATLSIDLNADGYSDILFLAGTDWYYRFSVGTTFGPTIYAFPSNAVDSNSILVLDWDSDGYEDLIARNPSTNTWHRLRSNGEALETTWTNTGIAAPTSSGFAGDPNADGLDDILFTNGSNVWSYRAHAGVVPDLLKTATDGFGNQLTYNYIPITQGSYTKYTTAAFPEQDYQGPVYVVSSTNASNGIGGTYSLTYLYYGAATHRQGRGFEGFAARRVQDSRTDLFVFDYFHRLFPLTGGVMQHDELQTNALTKIAQTVSSFQTNTQGTGTETRYFPFVPTATAKRWEVGGAFDGNQISETVTTTLVDSYGTPYDVTTVSTEKSTGNGVQPNAQYTSRLYHPLANLTNDTTNWCLGRPGRTETTGSHTQYGGSAITRVITRTWNTSLCRPTQEVIEPGNPTLQVTRDIFYDGFGNVWREDVTGKNPDGTNMAARTAQSNWGSAGRFPETVTNALGQVTDPAYDYAQGLKTVETDPNGIAASWQYDLFGRKTRENRPDDTYTTSSYMNCVPNCVNGRNKLIVTETAYSSLNAPITDVKTYLDTFDRVLVTSTKLLSGTYNRQEREYDNRGNVLRESEPCYWGAGCTYWKTATFDVLNRPTQVSRPVSQADPTLQNVTTHYDGLTTRTVDALSKTKKVVSNVGGRLARSIDHANYYQNFDYDGFGNPVRVQDSANPVNTLQSSTFDVRGMKTSMTDMDMGGPWTYEYNSLGEMLKIRDAKTTAPAWTTVMTYDDLGRMTTRQDVPEAVTSTWTWGISDAAKNIGRLYSLTTSDSSYSEIYGYDSDGRPLSTSITINGQGTHQLSYSYNVEGSLDTLTYPASTGASPLKLQYEYASGALKRIKDFNPPSTVFWQANTVDARDQVTQEAFANGVVTNRTYDAVTGWLGTMQSGIGGGAAIQNLGYLFDKSGNLTQRQDNRQGLTESFYYDDLYRLDYSTLKVGAGAPTTNLDLAYDQMGNITSKSDVGSFTYHPTKKHAVTTAGSYTYAYDPNGNVETRHGNAITWYSHNLAKRINYGSTWNEYKYGPNHDRYRLDFFDGSVTQTTLYIGGVLEKWTKGALTEWRHYISAGGQPVAIHTRQAGSASATLNRYLHLDHQGSVETVTSSDGSVHVRESFDAFGKRRNANGWSGAIPSSDATLVENLSRRGYTFHESIDAATLIHMNGRVQDPITGRFLSADPFIQFADDTQSWNRYSYVNNNPLSYTDPSGFFLKKLLRKLKKALRSALGRIRDLVINAVVFVAATYLCGGNLECGRVALNIVGRARQAYSIYRHYDRAYQAGAGPPASGAPPPSVGPQVPSSISPPFPGADYGPYSPSRRGWHEYRTDNPVCAARYACSPLEIRRELARRSVPGYPGRVIDGGEYSVIDPRTGIPAGNVTVDVSADGLTITNTTIRGHVFHSGRIVRTAYQRNGAWYVSTHGYGNPVVPGFNHVNDWQGPRIFNYLDEQMRAALEGDHLAARPWLR